MNNIFNIPPLQIKNLYNSIVVSYKGKEKSHMILEPLQSMIVIALLSISPVGTKIGIYENILYLQSPSIVQPISRWYNSDKKDDLYFLFQVIKRFIKWYNYKSTSSPLNEKLYNLLVLMGRKGLDNLLQTYQANDCMSIVQVILMYQDILVNKTGIDTIIEKESSDTEINNNVIVKKETHNIDEVFEKITCIYDKHLLKIIYNLLLLIQNETDESNITNFINGLNSIMHKNNENIRIWIKNNLIA
jgi:hypothetical protein